MIVYRLMNEKELNLYLKGEVKNIGSVFNNHVMANNHTYKKDQKYVHVFRNLKYMEYIQFERDFQYIATFDVPSLVLMASKGKGLYKKFKNGKLKYKYIREFAIEAEKIKPEYFLGFEEIEKYEPSISDYMSLFKGGMLITSDDDIL